MASPARPAWISCVLAAGGAAVLASAAWATGVPMVVPSLGPSLISGALGSGGREHAPAAILLGHGVAVAAALGALAAFGLVGEPSALVAGVTFARLLAIATALGLTLAGMLAVGRVHAPAGATALLVVLGIVRAGGDVAVLLLATACTAALVASFPRAAARLAGRSARVRHPARRRAARA